MLSVETGSYFRVVQEDLIEKAGGGQIVDDEEIHGKSVPGREKSSAKALRQNVAGMLQEQQGSQQE